MSELNLTEIEAVSGAISFSSIGFTFGWFFGAGTKTQQRVNSYDNEMLSAMQYGA